MTTTVELTEGNYDRLVNTTALWVIDVGAPWCAPCRDMKGVFQNLSKTYFLHADLQFGTVNTETASELCNMLNVDNLPTFLFMKDGTEEGRIIGRRTLEELIEGIKKWLL